MSKSIFNSDLLATAFHAVQAQQKQAFVDAGAAGGQPAGGDPAAAGGDPAAAGGAPPPGGDPAMAMQDPAMMAQAPPAGMDAGAMGAQPGPSRDEIQQMIQQAVMQSGGGGGGGGSGGPLKPKIDVNVALMQLSKMVARIADHLKIPIPAAEMIATPQDLTAMSSQQSTGAAAGAGGQAAAAGAGAAPASAISPIGPIQGAMPQGGGGGGQKQSQVGYHGCAVPADRGMHQLSTKAGALASTLRARTSLRR